MKECAECGKGFSVTPRQHRKKYCSARCKRTRNNRVAYIKNSRQLRRLHKQQGGKCALCGCVCTMRERALAGVSIAQQASIDHITPLSAGGEDAPRNTWMLCRGCNSRKGAKAMRRFLWIWLVRAKPQRWLPWCLARPYFKQQKIVARYN